MQGAVRGADALSWRRCLDSVTAENDSTLMVVLPLALSMFAFLLLSKTLTPEKKSLF